MYIHSSDWSIKRVRLSLLIFLILFIIVIIIIIIIITLYIVASQVYSTTKKTMSEMLFLPNHAPEIHSPNCSVYCCLRSKNCVGLDFPGIVIDLIWANSGRLNLKTTQKKQRSACIILSFHQSLVFQSNFCCFQHMELLLIPVLYLNIYNTCILHWNKTCELQMAEICQTESSLLLQSRISSLIVWG